MNHDQPKNPNEEDELLHRINRKTYGKNYNALNEYMAGRRSAPRAGRRLFLCFVGLGIAATVALLVFFYGPGLAESNAPSQGGSLVAYLAEIDRPIALYDMDVSRSTASAGDKTDGCVSGYRYYRSGAYERALPIFSAPALNDPHKLRCRLLAADCQWRLGQFEAAIDGFTDVTRRAMRAKNGDMAYMATFNKGCTQLRAGLIEAGRRTLRIIENRGPDQERIAQLLRLTDSDTFPSADPKEKIDTAQQG